MDKVHRKYPVSKMSRAKSEAMSGLFLRANHESWVLPRESTVLTSTGSWVKENDVMHSLGKRKERTLSSSVA